jgi:hypothetical protein
MNGAQPLTQFRVGPEGTFTRGGPSGVAVGGFISTAQDFLGFGAYVDYKYRFLDLNPWVLPFLRGGAGLVGAVNEAKNAGNVFAATVRAGLGFDVVLTARLRMGFEATFGLGPQILPKLGFLAMADMLVSVGFVL